MNIAYVAHIRLPTEKAHGYQIMRVCSELAKLGNEVVLYVPRRKNAIQDDPFSYYGIEKNFRVEYVPCFDALAFVKFLGPLAFWISMRSFLRNLTLPADALVYTRDADAVAYLSTKGYRCIYSAHNWKASRAARIRGAQGVVCNSKGTEAAVRGEITLPTVVSHNASDPNPFVFVDKKEVRRELGLPLDAKIAAYTGHLYGWKGGEVLIECAQLLPETFFTIVGGTAEDIENMRRQIPSNVTLVGHKPKKDIPKYLVAADVLVLPNTTATEESMRYTSPIKMFEYMASGTPIVASDLSSLREVLTEDMALFVPAGDVHALARGVKDILSNPDTAGERARKALEESKKHTWENHAKLLADFFASVA